MFHTYEYRHDGAEWIVDEDTGRQVIRVKIGPHQAEKERALAKRIVEALNKEESHA